MKYRTAAIIQHTVLRKWPVCLDNPVDHGGSYPVLHVPPGGPAAAVADEELVLDVNVMARSPDGRVVGRVNTAFSLVLAATPLAHAAQHLQQRCRTQRCGKVFCSNNAANLTTRDNTFQTIQNNALRIITGSTQTNNNKIICHDFLPTPRRGSQVKSGKTHTQSSRYTP